MMRSFFRHARMPLVVLGLYLVARLAFDSLTVDDRLLTPGGAPRTFVAILGLVVLLLRLFVLFVLPAVIAWRVCDTSHSARSRSTKMDP